MKHATDNRRAQSRRGTGSCTLEELESRRLLANRPIVVSTLHDELDANRGRGDLSLREAIAMAEDAEGEDVIDFAPSVRGTIKLSPSLGELRHFLGTITINGPGADRLTIDGRGSSRVLSLLDNATVTGLRVTGGAASFGAGIRVGSDSRAVLERLMIDGNRGEGLHVSGVATASDCTIANNRGNSGGGIRVGAFLTLIRATVTGNRAVGRAGEGGDGGGLYVDGGDVTIVNSTFSGNSAVGSGGGIYFRSNASGGTLTNLTVVGNEADSDHDGAGAGGGLFAASVWLTVRNSIVAANRSVPAAGAVPDDVFDDWQALTPSDNPHNLIGTPRGNMFVNGANGNKVGAEAAPLDARLGSLQANGGLTLTCAPRADSPVVDAGSNASAADAGLEVDQRGFARVVNRNGGGVATVDIGAVELQAGVALTVASVTVAPRARRGATGHADVYLRTDPGLHPKLGAYQLEIRLPAGTTGVALTGAGRAANALFAGQIPKVISTGLVLRVADHLRAAGRQVPIADGGGLVRVNFEVAKGTPAGVISLTVTMARLYDGAGNALPSVVDGGTIRVAAGKASPNVLEVLMASRRGAAGLADGNGSALPAGSAVFYGGTGSGSVAGEDVLLVGSSPIASLPTPEPVRAAARGRSPFGSVPVAALLTGEPPDVRTA